MSLVENYMFLLLCMIFFYVLSEYREENEETSGEEDNDQPMTEAADSLAGIISFHALHSI